jgi:hypothetical protein
MTSINLYSQVSTPWNSTSIIYDKILNISSNICFIDINKGHLLIDTDNPIFNGYWNIYSTTNGGNNWNGIPRNTFPTNASIGDYYDSYVCFINNNTGFVATHVAHNTPTPTSEIIFYKTTNNGINWSSTFTTYNSYTTYGHNSTQIKFINNNTGYINSEQKIYKTTNGGNNFQIVAFDLSNPQSPGYGGMIRKFEVKENGTINVCGEKYNILNGTYYPLLAQSTDYGANFTFILDGTEHPEIGNIISLCTPKDNDLVLFSHRYDNKLDYIFKYSNGSFDIKYISDYDFFPVDISSSKSGDLYFTEIDLHIIGYYFVKNYFSSDNGQTWNNELQTFQLNGPVTFLENVNDIMLYNMTKADINNPDYFYSNLCVRNLDMLIKLYDETTSLSGRILSINGLGPYDIPQGGRAFSIKGGIVTLSAELNNGGPDKNFYKWNDASVNPNNSNYYIDTKGEISAIYKTKLKSTDENAIKNISQTKLYCDSATHFLHQIHQSMGGIFYINTNSENGPFGYEEIVNSGNTYNSQFPNDKTAEGNRNPSITDIKWFGMNQVNFPATYKVASVWERYNSQTGKNQIFCAIKVDQVNNPWLRYGTVVNNLSGIIREFDSEESYNSKPDIVTAFIERNGDPRLTSNYFYIIPHLEPEGKLIMTVKYKNFVGIDPNPFVPYYNDNNFFIEENNVSDFSIIGSQYRYDDVNHKGYFLIHFSYKKNNEIFYRMEKITIYLDDESIYREWFYDENYYLFSVSHDVKGDECSNPDISLRNGLPVVTFQSHYQAEELVQYEGEETQVITVDYYPICVRFKINEDDWSMIYVYNSNTEQTKPDIEGSRNANAYIVNIKKGSNFIKYVKIDHETGFYCSPQEYSGLDSKLAKGSYSGTYGVNSLLLTLSNPVNSLYEIGTQTFTITNNTTDKGAGFNNLSGSFNKNHIDYIFPLGPIIVKNTVNNFDDSVSPENIENAVDFNESMFSKIFKLNNGDTLILGARGYYIPNPIGTFSPIKFHVDLINNSTNQIQRELFRDTVNVSDSVDINFFRGYIISGLQNGSDSFYVQMVLDTADVGGGQTSDSTDYSMSGIYQDQNQGAGGDAPRYKRKVFFENQTPNSNIINNLPTKYELQQNYPNPFNPLTTIKYALPQMGFVNIKIYDITGREILKLVNEYKQAGYHSIVFNGSNLASGVYFYRIEAGSFIQVKKMVLIK